MDNITEINSQKFVDYETMKKIREHAALYENAYDKKEFLKNVSVHEQKIILMNSNRPYEVLNYLDELDLKSSRLLLDELDFDEIKHIISLFSSEDKKKFYSTFSDLSLVNQFIVQDKNSSQHVEDLTFERKVELIDSSDKQTQVATSVVYESMPYEQRISATEKVTDVDAISALENTAIYNETQQQETIDNELEQVNLTQKAQIESKETEPEESEQKLQKQIPEQQQELKQNLLEEKEEQKEKSIEDKNHDKIKQQDDKNLKKETVEESFEENVMENDISILEEFQQERNKCEKEEILNLINKKKYITEQENIKIM